MPSLNLAIELNGPVHYLPLFGESKFKKIQAADKLKQIELQSAGCKLIVINTSAYSYFKNAKVMLEEYYRTQIKRLLDV